MVNDGEMTLVCQRCAACCKWPGDVFIEDVDVEAIASHLEIDEAEFIDKFTRLRANRTGLSITEKETGECVFLDGIDCRIQAAKPAQCRGFPNRWQFSGWRDVCEAVEVPASSHPAA
ncbi:MAG: YkgJ family cysteine cluster protein [Verrucomicrobiota bacterium]